MDPRGAGAGAGAAVLHCNCCRIIHRVQDPPAANGESSTLLFIRDSGLDLNLSSDRTHARTGIVFFGHGADREIRASSDDDA